MNTSVFKGVAVIGTIFIILSGFFIVPQTHQAIVLQFGQLKTVHLEPGLKFKIPFIQDVMFYERRVLDYDTPPLNVTTSDQKRLVVNAYTRYKITDPLIFFQSVKPSTEAGAHMRLEPIVSSSIRNIMGRSTLPEILNLKRAEIMRQIESEIAAFAKPLGLTIIDVRVTRSELPTENRAAVFARMNSELVRYAKQNRAEGEEKAQFIRSKANTERTILLGEARRLSQELKSQGDAEAIKLTNSAFGKDPEFYNFYKTLDVYKNTIAKKDTNIIMSTNSSFLRLLKKQPKLG